MKRASNVEFINTMCRSHKSAIFAPGQAKIKCFNTVFHARSKSPAFFKKNYHKIWLKSSESVDLTLVLGHN